MMCNNVRTYTELMKIPSYEGRYHYLRIQGVVGESSFGFDRYLNQEFYRSQRWRAVRDQVMLRDEACDLGVEGYEIYDMVIVHHINPITLEEIERDDDCLYDPEYLICTSRESHQAIHYGDERLLMLAPVERYPNDTIPWRSSKWK